MNARRAFPKFTIAAMAETALSISRVWERTPAPALPLSVAAGRGREA